MEGNLFLTLILQIFLIATQGQVRASDGTQKNLQQNPNNGPYRTAYHFQPPKNWMNDPNGPMYYNGIYHLFYQYNSYSAVWGNISWGHSISYNLVDWIHIEHAVNPTEPYDINGCWSGSATILPGGNPVILYTGADFKKRQVQNLAVPKNLSDPYLREWIKYDHNPLMTPADGIDPQFFRDPTTAWQGPDKNWRVVVGSQINGHGTALLYRSKDFVKWKRSDRPLHFSNKTGMWECPDFYPVSVNGIYGLDSSVQGSRTKHVLKASFNDLDYYIIGTYEPQTNRFSVIPDFMDRSVKLRYDYGIFYASKTFYDSAKRRRILWGWVTEADGESDDINKGWSGLQVVAYGLRQVAIRQTFYEFSKESKILFINGQTPYYSKSASINQCATFILQSLPRSIFLDKTGKQLSQWPIEEIERLRIQEVNLQNNEIEGGTTLEITGITASQADIEVSFHLPNLDEAELMHPEWLDPQLLCSEKNASTGGVLGPFGLLALATEDLTEHTAIFFRIFKGHDKHVVLMCSDQSRSSLTEELKKIPFGAFLDLDPAEKISLRSLIDHSIIESFGGEGKSCITARVYPKLALGNKSHVYVFNNGTQSVTSSNLSAWSMKKAQIFSLHKRRKREID